MDSLKLNHSKCGLDIGGTLAKIVYIIYDLEGVGTKILAPNKEETKCGFEKDKCRSADTSNVSDSAGNIAESVGQQSTTSDKHFEKVGNDKLIHEYAEEIADATNYVSGRSSDKDCRVEEKHTSEKASLAVRLTESEVLCFGYFHTCHIEKLIEFLKDHHLVNSGEALKITGGGAYKYRDLLTRELSVSVQKVDEMESIMRGLRFLLENTNSLFKYNLKTKQKTSYPSAKLLYPFLMVNIGSGISILKVSAPDTYSRVTGTCIGGGTVLGLARRICGAETFDQVLRWAESGTDSLDLKVGDLFGDAAGSRCLPPSAMASSFGRLYIDNTSGGTFPAEADKAKKEDIAWSLVHMVSYNIGYIAYLVGVIHGIRRVIFSGKFVNNKSLTMESITHGVHFYIEHYEVFHHHSQMFPAMNLNTPVSEGDPPHHDAGQNKFDFSCVREPFEVLFLEHDGYLGAIGSWTSPSESLGR